MSGEGSAGRYKPFRVTLKALWREFRRLSLRYPPIYHELFIPQADLSGLKASEVWRVYREAHAGLYGSEWDGDKFRQIKDTGHDLGRAIEQGRSLFSGADREEKYVPGNDVLAQIRAIRERNAHRFVTDWEEWHGPEDVSFLGRFTGSPKGLTEFRLLAESAYQTVCEIDPGVAGGLGYHGWLRVVHDIARACPSPLLKSDSCMMMVRFGPGPDGIDRPDDADGGLQNYPVTSHLMLTHNVFASSMTAIEFILDGDGVLLIGTPWDYSGMPEHLAPRLLPKIKPDDREAQVGERVTVPDEENGGSRPTGFVCELRFHDERWTLAFGVGERYVEERFDPMNGLSLYALLLDRPDKFIPPLDLEQKIGKGRAVEDDIGYDPDDFDPEPVRKMRQWVAVTKKAVETAREGRNTEEEGRLLNELRTVESNIKRATERKGRPRLAATASPKEKARKRVWKNLNDARSKIRSRVPEAAAYLEKTVDFLGGDFIYRPLTVYEI